MRREGRRPVAARRRPESSDFNKTFPQSGNDNLRDDHPMRYPINPATIHHRALALLDSGLRRNDDGGRG